MNFFTSNVKSVRKAFQVLALGLGLLIFCVPSFAQLNLGRIFGTVSDQTGGAVVGATVTVIDVDRGISRPLVSDGAGQFDATSLIPGKYTVRVEATGFKLEEHTDIDVGVGKEVRVDMTLQPGAQTTTVTVTGDLPMINTTNAELATTLENIAVTELPMNGRNYQYLVWTRPGVVMSPTEGQQDFTTDGMNVDFVVFMFDGVNDSNLLVGGPSNAGGAETAPAGGLDEQTIMPADAIQEVNTGTSSFPAEYGEKPGAHIDAGIKSGSNAFHGNASGFGRDTSLNAKNPFLATPPGAAKLPKSPLTLEQFAASLGGPIKKDKIFFFADFEGQRYTAGVVKNQAQPTTADISGLNTCGASGAAGTCAGSVGATYSIPDAIFAVANGGGAPVNPLSLNLAGCSALTSQLLNGNTTGNVIPASGAFTNGQLSSLAGMSASTIAGFCNPNPIQNVFGNGNSPGNGLGPGQIITDFTTQGGSNNGIIKVDWHPSDKNSINFDWYSGGGDTTSAAFSQQYYAADFHTWANFGRAVWVWTPNASWLNEFRFGYDYGNFPDYSHECDHPGSGPNYAALGFDDGNRQCSYESGGPGRDIWGGFPIMTVTGFVATGGSVTMQDNFGTSYTFLDSVSWTHGKHTVKFGTEVRLGFLNAAAMTDNQGTVNFTATSSSPNAFSGATALDNYVAGLASSGVLLNGDPNRKTHLPTMGLYIQDSWRVTPRITVNYGIRYEYTWPWSNPGPNPSAPGTPAQPANLWGNFDQSLGTATDLVQETPGHYVYQIWKWNFAPRLGIAWDVFGNGKTVVHSGMSVMDASSPQGLQVLYSGGAELNAVPTGFIFFDQANPGGMNYLGVNTTTPPAGSIQTTTASFATVGVTGAGATSALPWVAQAQGASPTSLYPSTLGTFNTAYTCGDGNTYQQPGQAAGVTFKPAFCAPQVITPVYHMPYYLMYSLSIQHAFTNNFTMDIAYVGNTGDEVAGNINENSPTPGGNTTGVCPVGQSGNPASTVEQCRRPYNTAFPFYGNITLQTSFEHANYNALQASVTQRLSHGLQITPSLTWQRTFSFGAGPNPYDPQLSWAPAGNPLDFTITATYYLPKIKAPAQLLEGWEVNSTVYMLSAAPTTITDSADDLIGNGAADPWDIVGQARSFHLGSTGHPVPCFGVAGSTFAAAGNCTKVATLANMPAVCLNAAANEPINPNVPVGSKNSTGSLALASLGCYVTGNLTAPSGALLPNAQGTIGDEGFGTIYGHGFRNWDLSVLKNWKFKERYGVQFRAEFFNVLNRTLLNGAGGVAANTPASLGQITTDPDSSNPVIGNGPRKIQLGLKLSF